MLFGLHWGFGDWGWELSQFALAILTNFGTSLHNAVSQECNSSWTEHVAIKNRTLSHNNSYINHEAGGGTKIIVTGGSWTPVPATQTLTIWELTAHQPRLSWNQMAKINQVDPVKSGNMTVPPSRQCGPYSPDLLGDLILRSQRIHCCRSHGRHVGFTARLKPETELSLNSILTGVFSWHGHKLCSI